MTPNPPERYRKLPGRRRGLIRGWSVWAGSDHLLLVQSYRFREEYKRFYYRDVQAIAVAHAPRFHVSTRAIFTAAVLWIAVASVTFGLKAFKIPFPEAAVLGAIALALLAIWAVVSWGFSCRCRIYTAVSSDALPSVYRRWIARKFLAAIEPLIAGTQGVIEGEWAEAADRRGVGPEASRVAVERLAIAEQAEPPRTVFSDFLIAALFADAAVLYFLPAASILFRWAAAATGLAVVAAAIAVMIQRHRGGIRAVMQKLAIAAMIVVGILYYADAVGAGLIAGVAAQNARKQGSQLSLTHPDVPVIRFIRVGLEAALGAAGIALSLAAQGRPKNWNKLVE